MRILIAEDEVTIARALKVMLEKNKYAVDMVHNGNDALDYGNKYGCFPERRKLYLLLYPTDRQG